MTVLYIKSLRETNNLLSICEEGNSDEIMKYLNDHPDLILSIYNYQIYHLLCRNGNLEVLKKSMKKQDKISNFDYDYFFKIAIQYNQIDIIKYYFFYFRKFIDTSILISLSIREDKYNIFKFLIKYIKLDENIRQYYKDAIKYNNIKVLIDLLEYKEKLKVSSMELLTDAAIYEQVESYNFIINNFNCYNKDDKVVELFYTICSSSSVEILELFLENNIKFDLKINNCKGLILSILNENLDISKYLISIDNKQINFITSEDIDEVLFDEFMSFDSLINIFNLIPQLDVTKNDNYFFRQSCLENKIDIVKRLIKKYPELYHADIDGNTITKWHVIKKLKITDDKLVDNLEDCPICYNKSNVITNCNHQYCKKCLTQVYQFSDNNFKCSICRKQIEEIYCIKK